MSLLKHKVPLSMYMPDTEIMLEANQPAEYRDYRTICTKPEVFLFKLLTMTDNLVQEEFSFTFDVRSKCSQDKEAR